MNGNTFRHNGSQERGLTVPVIINHRNYSFNISLFVNTTDDFEQTSELSAFVLGLFMFIVGSIGVFGNVTSIIVFSRREMRSPVAVLLLGVSCADLALILLCLATFGVQNLAMMSMNDQVYNYLILSTVTTYPLMHIVQSISLWLLVLITVERYIAVSYPFLAQRIMNTRRALICLFTICLASLIYNLARFLEWKLSWLDDGSFRHEKGLRANTAYFEVYFTGLYLVTHFAIPLLVLGTLNARIAFLVRKAQVERRHLSNSQQSEHRVAIMMIIVILIFIICRTTPSILNILESIKRDIFTDPDTEETAWLFTDISNALVILNISTTWVIYYLFNRRYRLLFRYIYNPCKTHKKFSFSVNTYAAASTGGAGYTTAAAKSTAGRLRYSTVVYSNSSNSLHHRQASQISLCPTNGRASPLTTRREHDSAHQRRASYAPLTARYIAGHVMSPPYGRTKLRNDIVNHNNYHSFNDLRRDKRSTDKSGVVSESLVHLAPPPKFARSHNQLHLSASGPFQCTINGSLSNDHDSERPNSNPNSRSPPTAAVRKHFPCTLSITTFACDTHKECSDDSSDCSNNSASFNENLLHVASNGFLAAPLASPEAMTRSSNRSDQPDSCFSDCSEQTRVFFE